MKVLLFFSSLFTLAIVACDNPKGQTNDTQATAGSDTATTAGHTQVSYADTTVTGCFSQINKRDTATLQLDAKGITITGPLSYNYFEKDRNGGTLVAEVAGDVLTGWYLFRSEGVMSVRQVEWKIRNNKLWPAIGEMKERNDSMIFVNPDKLSYDSTHPFVKIACVL